MSALFFALGNLLVLVSIGGLLVLGLDLVGGPIGGTSDARMETGNAAASSEASRAADGAATQTAGGSAPVVADVNRASPDGAGGPTQPTALAQPVTRIVVPRISLEADVVPARLVEREGGTTWEVPAHRAGHAEHTAGAGDPGNAVLLGHVASRSLGNVFEHLDQVRAGDVVQLFSGTRRFEYRATDVRSVQRTDVSVLQPTDTASLSLITCTGLWLPHIWDYTERLVVRAELSGPPE